MKHFAKQLIHEPLFHFLVIGALLFLVSGLIRNSGMPQSGRAVQLSNTINVSQGQIDHMKAQFTRTWQRPPTKQEVKGLIDDYVISEISYREATAMGLDRDDPVIRRRMRLKLETLNEDIAAATSVTDQVLSDYLAEHPESFRFEPKVAFRQVYLDIDRRGIKADADALALLERLRAAGPDADLSGLGDSLMMMSKDVPLLTVSEIERMFGEPFGRNLLDLSPGRWEGPVWSGFGLHLVLVLEIEPGRLPELSEVRDQVEREWLFQRKKEMQDAMYQKLRERYTVVIESAPGPVEKGSAMAATLPAEGRR